MSLSFTLFALIILLSLLLFSGVLIYLSARVLFLAVFSRSVPSILKKRSSLSKITKSEDFVKELSSKSRTLEEKSTETVEIDGYGGVRLRGHILSAVTPRRLVIAVHGWRGSWCRDFGIVSEFFHASDTTTLFVEQRGQQGSGGDSITFGICERYDIIEWVKWAADRFPELPIYLCGVSMGATSILMSASLGLSDRVHGIIADSGFTSPVEIWRYVIRQNLHLPYAIYARAVSRECMKRTGQNPDDCSTLTALKDCSVPVLFIHGEEDSFVPLEMTYQNYYACPSPKRLFVIPGANHCMGYYIDPIGYEKEMTEFWQEYD